MLTQPEGLSRPIASGTILRRTAAQSVATHFKETVATTLGDMQFAIGIPSGPDIMYRTLQLHLQADTDNAIITLDIAKAFQTLEPTYIHLSLIHISDPTRPY